MRKGTRPALDEVTKKLPYQEEPDEGVRLLTEAQVRARVPISRVTLWRWEAQGEFPKRVKLGDFRVGWPEGEIDAWIAARMAARNVEPETAA
jgi:prophage regulatory protein